MRWCRFADADGPRFGVVADDEVCAVDGTPFGEYRRTSDRRPLTQLQLLPPVLPSTFFCVGLNYTAHIRHAQARGVPAAVVPERPEVGYRANSALTGHGSPIVKPADCTGPFEAEGELVAVIGRSLRRCSRDEAQAGVFGWTIGNDVSARDWQHGDRTQWRAKNADTFKPMGPWIETDVDPMTSRTIVDVDGTPVAEFGTGEMIFDPFDYICEISRYITLSPGDVLWMGADASVEMRPGTELGVTITGIGTLRNPVHDETLAPLTEENRR